MVDEAGKFIHILDLDDNVKAVAIPVRRVNVEKPDIFMASLRSKMPKVILQAINAKFVLDIEHLWTVIKQSWISNKKGISKVKFDLDIILRISCSSNLNSALNAVGLKSGLQDVIFVGIGPEINLKTINDVIMSYGKLSNDLFHDDKEKTSFLKKYHDINDLALNSVIAEQGKLAKLLAEKAAVIVPMRY